MTESKPEKMSKSRGNVVTIEEGQMTRPPLHIFHIAYDVYGVFSGNMEIGSINAGEYTPATMYGLSSAELCQISIWIQEIRRGANYSPREEAT